VKGRRFGGGKTALLPVAEQPCPSCTSVVDGLNGPATDLSDRVNLVAVAKTDPARLGTYAQERGWRNLRLLSSRNNTFNRDYHGETPEGEQLPVLNVFSRDEDGIHHRWASELTFVRGDNSPLDPSLADLGGSPPPRCSTSKSHPWIKPAPQTDGDTSTRHELQRTFPDSPFKLTHRWVEPKPTPVPP
jgi:hypothetical protein